MYVVNKTQTALAEWLNLRGDTPGALFLSVNKGGKVSSRRLQPTAIYNMIEQRRKTAGLKKITPHDFRRTFISNLLDEHVDAVTITKLTGHASVDLLKRYDRRPERAKMDAVKKLDLPI